MLRKRKTQDRAGSGQGSGTDDGTHWISTAVLLARVGGIGWFVVASIGLPALGGFWLDGVLDTRPLLMIIGIVLGVAIAFAGLFRLVRSFSGSRQ